MRSTTVFYLFTFLFRFGLGAVGALYAPFLADIGLTFAQISAVNAVYWVAMLAFEVPTGMIADGRGRGWSVAAAMFCYAVGGFWYFLADGFWHAASAELISAVGGAFLSGALSSWIVDAPDRTQPVSKVFGTATVITGIATALGTLLATGLFVTYGRGVAFAVHGAASLCAFAFALLAMRGKEPERTMSEFKALRCAVAHMRESKPMQWAAAIQASYGIFQTFNMFWAPLLLTRLSQAQIGHLWIGMYCVLAVSGFAVRTRFGAKDGTGAGMALSLVLSAVPMIGFAFLPSIAAWIILLVAHEFGRGAFAPFADTYLHERIEPGYRATFSSLQSFAQEIGMAATLIVMSVVMRPFDNDPHAILWLWAGSGAFSLALTSFLWIRRPR